MSHQSLSGFRGIKLANCEAWLSICAPSGGAAIPSKVGRSCMMQFSHMPHFCAICISRHHISKLSNDSFHPLKMYHFLERAQLGTRFLKRAETGRKRIQILKPLALLLALHTRVTCSLQVCFVFTCHHAWQASTCFKGHGGMTFLWSHSDGRLAEKLPS